MAFGIEQDRLIDLHTVPAQASLAAGVGVHLDLEGNFVDALVEFFRKK